MKIVSTILSTKLPREFNLKLNSQRSFDKNLKLVEKPIIANLKSYYRTAKEKLNDIYLERLEKGYSISDVKHNKEKFDELPERIQKAIKPEDISNSGCIDQSLVDKLWDAYKEAEPNKWISSYPPRFRGATNTDLLNNQNIDTFHADIIPEVNVSNTLDLIPNTTGLADGLADNVDVISDIASEAISDIGEHSVGLLEHIIDIIT